MNKILAFVLLVLTFIGIVGGIGYACYCKAWPVAVGIVVTGYMAWPKFRECWKTLVG